MVVTTFWYHVLRSERITQYSWWTSTLNSICPEHGQCYHLHQIKKCHWVANTAHKILLVSNLSCSLSSGRTTLSKGEPVSTICMQCDNSKIDHQCNFGPRIWGKVWCQWQQLEEHISKYIGNTWKYQDLKHSLNSLSPSPFSLIYYVVHSFLTMSVTMVLNGMGMNCWGCVKGENILSLVQMFGIEFSKIASIYEFPYGMQC